MNYKIIDFHVHPFFNENENFCFYENIINNENEFINNFERAGISHFCGSVIKRFTPQSFSEIAELNQKAFDFQEKYPDKYTAGIHIHPDFVDESINELKKYSEKGVKLVGELCPYLMGWKKIYTEEMQAIYETAQQLNLIVSYHSFSCGTLEPSITDALEKFPNLIFVAAHPHEKALLEEHIRRLNKYDNYYLDLSGTGIARYGTVKHLVDKAGSEKILFGSDYPINNPKMYVEAVLYENLKTQDYENIFSENAKRLLKLK